MRGFPFYQQLTSLGYRGEFYHDTGMVLDAAMFATHLTRLHLISCSIRQDLMAALEKLHDVKVLFLIEGIDEDPKQMRCSAGGFPHLQYLNISGPRNLEEREIEEGAMPMLQELGVRYFPMLLVPLGLEHLTTLCKLTRQSDNDQSETTKADEIRNLCRHVPNLDLSTY